MDLLEHIKQDSLHHAYLIEGNREEALPALRDLLSGFGVSLSGNPDYREYHHDAFLVEHARLLKSEERLRPVFGEKKYFVITLGSIIDVAQHALLKTLEEPTSGTHFFFIARSRALFLPTLISRFQVLAWKSDSDTQNLSARESADGDENIAHRFLVAELPERMKIVEKMIKVKPDEKGRAKEEARVFLALLEHEGYKKFHSGHAELAPFLRNIISAKRELAGRAPSLKLLLEHLALTAPIFR